MTWLTGRAGRVSPDRKIAKKQHKASDKIHLHWDKGEVRCCCHVTQQMRRVRTLEKETSKKRKTG